MSTMNRTVYNNLRAIAARDGTVRGQGILGAAYRFGRANPGAKAPGWLGGKSTPAYWGWKAGRDDARGRA